MTSIIRTIAPIHTGLAEVSGAADRDPQSAHTLWRGVNERVAPLRELPGVIRLDLHRLQQRSEGMQYRSLAQDSLAQRRELATIGVSTEALDLDSLLKRYAGRIDAIDEITLRVYPHEIALLEVSMVLAPIPPHAAEARLDRLEHETVDLTEIIGKRLCEKLLDPLVQAITLEDPKWRLFIDERTENDECRTRDQVMWVSRALLVTEADRPLMRHWLKDSIDLDDLGDLEGIAAGDTPSIVRWLNYGFVDERGEGAEAFRTGRHAAQYEGLRHAQEIYSALDHVDHRLRIVLAHAVSSGSRVSLDIMNEDLVRLSQRAEIIIMGRQELLKYMTRTVRGHFESIMAAWEYDVLVEQPALFKLELCARRLGELASKRTAKATIVTDIILLGIGITSIGGIALAISDFGRSTASDPRSTGFDMGASSFTSWFAAQPIDVVLLVSAAVSALLIVLYLYFRREDHG